MTTHLSIASMRAAQQAATTTTSKPVDVDAVLKAMRELEDRFEPIACWMRSQGFDPRDGCVMVLPTSMHHLASPHPPSYVLLSSLVLEPMLLRFDPRENIAPDLSAIRSDGKTVAKE